MYIFAQRIFELADGVKCYVAVEIYVFPEAQSAVVVAGGLDSVAATHRMLDGIDLILQAFVYAGEDKFTENIDCFVVCRQCLCENDKLRKGER